MATSAENAILKIMIEGVLRDAIFKTYGKACYLNDGSTVESAIANIITNISALPTASGVDEKIQTAVTNMKNQILGLTDADTTIDAAYDTLKEVATWINEHGDVASAFTTDIAELKTAVQSLQAVGATKVEASETNGNIKISGVETPVFTMPDTISASKITETSEKQFISAADKEELKARPVVYTGTQQPENMKNGDIFIQIVE